MHLFWYYPFVVVYWSNIAKWLATLDIKLQMNSYTVIWDDYTHKKGVYILERYIFNLYAFKIL